MKEDFRFSARTQTGEGRGKTLGTPTVNMMLEDVPSEMQEGIYACFAKVDGRWLQGALHYGPRPVFKAGLSCEVYLLDVRLESLPERIEVATVAYLRPVMDFPTPGQLQAQIAQDVEQTRAILERNNML